MSGSQASEVQLTGHPFFILRLSQKCSYLLKTIENVDDNQVQLELGLDSCKSVIKRSYKHFKI